MAPVKNVADTAKKVVRKRGVTAKPVKPALKTPTRITLKIANLGSKPPKIARKVTCKEKIELANEVALAQLTKPLDNCPQLELTSVAMEPNHTPEVKVKSKPKPKGKPSPKLVSEESNLDIPLAKKAAKSFADSTTSQSKPKSKKEIASSSLIKSMDKSELSAKKPIMKPGPKSKTIGKGKLDTSVQDSSLETNKSITKTKKATGRKRQQKIIPDYFSDEQTHDETIDSENIVKTPVKRVCKRKQTSKIPDQIKVPKNTSEETAAKKPRGRQRSKFISERLCGNKLKITNNSKKGKCMNAKEINAAASMLDNALGKEAAPVHTRSSSVGSSNSNLSWTRDISTATSLTSGTTTCVTVSSNDFIRFDNKLPFVQVMNTNLNTVKVMEDTPKKLLESDSSQSKSDSESTDSPSESISEDPTSKTELNLSTSSLSQSEGGMDNTELLCLEMDKLNNSLHNFYSEISKWMVCDDVDSVTFSAVLEAANLEKDMMSNLETFNGILDAVKFVTTKNSTENNETTLNSQKTGPGAECSRRNCEDGAPVQEPRNIDIESFEPYGDRPSSVKSYELPINNNAPDAKASPEQSICSSETFTNDNCNYLPFDDTTHCDDEDALSIFDLESITGVESSRLSSASVSNMSVQETYVHEPTSQEAYIPKPSRSWLHERYTYKPTRIEEYRPNTSLKTIQPNMIEKQKADSSSISKETDKNKAINLSTEPNRPPPAEDSIKTAETEQTNKPMRMFARYQPVNPVKSAIYRGHCFFHLSSQCKNNNICRFPHVDIDPNLIKTRLVSLNEDSLIEEYLLSCHFNNLRRKYGLLFIQECKRRQATKMLLEMAIDLGLGVLEREDNTLIVNVLETTLLHLNNISFDACGDKLTFKHKGRLLCDALLSCMADSQNFAQFKEAFVKLANFMAQIKRPVDIEVVSKILERVCILPGEDLLARGMMYLMQNTDPRIFENTMTKSFEVQLSNIESDAREAYLLVKKAVNASQLATASPAHTSANPRVGIEGPRHPSPDTTNMDVLKKSQMAQPTTFKCTIDTDAILHLFKSPCNPAPRLRYTGPGNRQWRRVRGYPPRGGRYNARPPTGRRVYRAPTGHRNGANP